MEASVPLVCRKAYLCRVTLVLVLHPFSRNNDAHNTSLYISIVTTSLLDCPYSLQKRNDHVWSFCRYTRSYRLANAQDPNEQAESSQYADSNSFFNSVPPNDKASEDELVPWVDHAVRAARKADDLFVS